MNTAWWQTFASFKIRFRTAAHSLWMQCSRMWIPLKVAKNSIESKVPLLNLYRTLIVTVLSYSEIIKLVFARTKIQCVFLLNIELNLKHYQSKIYFPWIPITQRFGYLKIPIYFYWHSNDILLSDWFFFHSLETLVPFAYGLCLLRVNARGNREFLHSRYNMKQLLKYLPRLITPQSCYKDLYENVISLLRLLLLLFEIYFLTETFSPSRTFMYYVFNALFGLIQLLTYVLD